MSSMESSPAADDSTLTGVAGSGELASCVAFGADGGEVVV
jgi:hypothetical protein